MSRLFVPVSLAMAALAGLALSPARTNWTSLQPVLPKTPAERSDTRPDARAGRVETYDIASRLSRRERRLWVYTPPGYAPSGGAGYEFLIVFDGGSYLNEIPLPKILDALLAEGKAPPTVAVLIDNASGAARLEDLANRGRFAAFLGEELVPWVRQRWNVTRDPRRTIVTGSSAGGLAAAYVALKRPDLFGNVLSQSGAFWRGNEGSNDPPWEWLTSQYASTPKRDIRFWLDVGTLESQGALGGEAPSILEANRRLRDALRKRGYAVTYAEVPGGSHSPSTWRQRLPAGIAALAVPAPVK
jgi:enterochelin esterase-like enzyme